jgi:acyl-CoA synthetase (AMP-forming)/AMP-acid ligase II/thioesterase domain-containing protein/acyl carrier protein
LRPDLPDAPGRAVACLEELSAGPADPTVQPSAPDDVALLMLTSGSTGNAKAVMLTHGNLLAAVSAKAERLGVTGGDVTMNWIAFDHIAAMEMHLLPLLLGASQVQAEPQTILGDPLRFLALIDAHRVTLTFTPNFLLGQIDAAVAQGGDRRWDLSPVRHIISGGEATVTATARRFLNRLAPFGLHGNALVPGFGMTETCAGCVYSTEFPDIDEGAEFASLGRPVRGLHLRVVDDQDLPLPDGTVGELQLRGPMVFGGYFANALATAAAFTADGWFRTGDRASLDGGRLTLAGRSKDSIIVNGVNYFSHDLEAVLERLDGIEKSYVAAFPTRPPGSDTEQLVVAFSPSGDLTDESEIHRVLVAVRSSVVLHWGFRPALVLPLPTSELPKTSLGKIPRGTLRRRLEAGEFATTEKWVAELTLRHLGGYAAPRGSAEIALADIYAAIFDVEPTAISATASFFDLGGTSLDILRLKHHVERRFGLVNLPVMRLLTAPTVRDLAGWLDGRDRADAVPDRYQPLVPLQRGGDKTPLFCVHPGVGEVLVFVNLAKYFVNERPFYALRARGFGAGESYFSSFAEMVQTYVDAVRAAQPHGPYALAGYSYGGAVAFEMAKTLESQGERVDFVGVFNLPPHIKGRMDEIDFAEGAVNLAFFLALITKEQAARLPGELRRAATRERQLEILLDHASARRLAELDLDAEKFASWVDLAQSMVDLGRTYEPSGTVKSLTVFYAIPLRGTKEDWLNQQLKKWDAFTREPNRYVDVAGEHYTLMGPKHVGTFQATLRRELDRALEGK